MYKCPKLDIKESDDDAEQKVQIHKHIGCTEDFYKPRSSMKDKLKCISNCL